MRTVIYGISLPHSSLVKENIMLPNDFKRKYKFRTDTSKEKKYINIAIIISIIMIIAAWLLIN